MSESEEEERETLLGEQENVWWDTAIEVTQDRSSLQGPVLATCLKPRRVARLVSPVGRWFYVGLWGSLNLNSRKYKSYSIHNKHDAIDCPSVTVLFQTQFSRGSRRISAWSLRYRVLMPRDLNKSRDRSHRRGHLKQSRQNHQCYSHSHPRPHLHFLQSRARPIQRSRRNLPGP